MRYFIPIILLLALVVGLAGIKYKQIATLIHFGKVATKAGPPPESVSTAVAKDDTWEGVLSAVGTITASKGVAVSNESPGVVSAIHFESGDVVRAGQVLVTLDTSVERAQLAAIAARRDLAVLTAGRSRTLVSKEAAPRSQLDNDEAQLKSSRADLEAIQAQIDRKVVRAPFAGRLGLRTVNLGQYLNTGTAVSVLESQGAVFIDFSLPQQNLADVHVGSKVRVRVAGGDGTAYDSVIATIDPTIDATTRSIKLRAAVPNKKILFRPGMFVNVDVLLESRGRVVSVPAAAIVHASFGDSVFVVESGKVRQQFVRTGVARGDFVAILDGIKPGQEVVTAGAFKLRNGVPVIVNNDVKLDPSLTPRPENR